MRRRTSWHRPIYREGAPWVVPIYLVQTVDMVMHAYWDSDALRIHLRTNPKTEVLKVYELDNSSVVVRYKPFDHVAWLESGAA